jgi:hypothetical protein
MGLGFLQLSGCIDDVQNAAVASVLKVKQYSRLKTGRHLSHAQSIDAV